MTIEAAYNEAGPAIVGWLVATGTDEATARDLLHDAVVRVSKWAEGRGEAAKTPGGDSLPAVLFTTAKNLRANRVRADAKLDFVDDVGDGPATGGADRIPSDAEYLRSRIARALRGLPEALRETYALYQVGERSVREVAEMTGASENLVKVRLHRAKAALRKALDDLKEA